MGRRTQRATGAGVCPGWRAWAPGAGRRRGRDEPASGALPIGVSSARATSRRCVRVPTRGGAREARCGGSRRRRIERHRGRGSADARRGIPDGFGPGRSVARHGCGVRCRAGRSRGRGAGVPEVAAIPRGIWSGACISISPKTGKTRRRRSPFWRPIRRG